jgi:hypothetical protein
MVKKVLKISGILLLICLISYVGWLYYQTKNLKLDDKEKATAVKNLLGHDARIDVAVPEGDQPYSNQYYSISYPKAAKEYHRDPTYKPSSLELSYFSFQESSPRLFFVISVLDHPGMTLTDFPSVSVRQKETDIYTSEPITVGGQKGIVFAKVTPDESSDREKSAFFAKDGHIYSFALSGGNMDDINSLFNSIISSLKFN